MYVDECKYKRGDKFCARALIRRSYREDRMIKHQTIANFDEDDLYAAPGLNS